MMNIDEILEYLPHRYPFLLVDRVTEVEKGKSIKGYKNISFNESFFQGHFPSKPVMPSLPPARPCTVSGFVAEEPTHEESITTILIRRSTVRVAYGMDH